VQLDYAVVEDIIVGRIYRDMILRKPKWRWRFLQEFEFHNLLGKFEAAENALPARGHPNFGAHE
jgi:hypothetical protein